MRKSKLNQQTELKSRQTPITIIIIIIIIAIIAIKNNK